MSGECIFFVSELGILCIDTMPVKQDVVLGWEDAERGVMSLIHIRDLGRQREVRIDRVWKHIRKNVQPKGVQYLKEKLRTDFQVQREFGEQKNIWRIPLYQLFLTIMDGYTVKTFP